MRKIMQRGLAIAAVSLGVTGCWNGTTDDAVPPPSPVISTSPAAFVEPTLTPSESPIPTEEPTPEPTPTEEPTPEPSEITTAPAEPTSTPSPTATESDTPTPSAATPEPTSSESATSEAATDEATQVLTLVNQHRTSAGCSPLTLDARLSQAAAAHSQDMAANNYFSHSSQDGRNPFQRMEAAGYPSPGAENIAMGYPDAQAVVTGWMNSDGHRANILNCSLTTMGLGTADSAQGVYWTQVFGF
ncbi:MAG: CAP domain-containing protein [Propionibacteriaceae bacterium]|nr:CAP domain-containing protein [Propionibacteriaceae bacterium]